jgi:cell division ATPase FtsA
VGFEQYLQNNSCRFNIHLAIRALTLNAQLVNLVHDELQKLHLDILIPKQIVLVGRPMQLERISDL